MPSANVGGKQRRTTMQTGDARLAGDTVQKHTNWSECLERLLRGHRVKEMSVFDDKLQQAECEEM